MELFWKIRIELRVLWTRFFIAPALKRLERESEAIRQELFA